MDGPEIKKRIDRCYEIISDANTELDEFRNICPHTMTKKVNYYPRIGQLFENTEVCAFCGELIKFADHFNIPNAGNEKSG